MLVSFEGAAEGGKNKPCLGPAFRQHAETSSGASRRLGVESLRERLDELLSDVREIEEMRAEMENLGGDCEARRLARLWSTLQGYVSPTLRAGEDSFASRAEERAAANRQRCLDDLARSPGTKERKKGEVIEASIERRGESVSLSPLTRSNDIPAESSSPRPPTALRRKNDGVAADPPDALKSRIREAFEYFEDPSAAQSRFNRSASNLLSSRTPSAVPGDKASRTQVRSPLAAGRAW